MAIVLPPCPKCSGIMRPSPNIDGVRCRCGFEVGYESVLYAGGLLEAQRALHLLHYGRMLQPPKADPGVRVSDQFSGLDAVCWDARGEKWPVVSLQDAAVAKGKECGLEYQTGDHYGSFMCIERRPRNGDSMSTVAQLEYNVMYGIAPRGSEIEAAERMVCAIANKHGRGRWWSTLEAVHVIADDGLARVADVGDVPHVYLRAMYFHDPSCPSCGEPCDRSVVGGVTINGCPCVGTDRAIAIDLSKLTKDPTSQGYSYSSYVEDAKRLAATRIDPSFFITETQVALSKTFAEVEQVLNASAQWERRIAGTWYPCDERGIPYDQYLPHGTEPIAGNLRLKIAENPAGGTLRATAAGRLDAVMTLAQQGAITAEQARELLETPEEHVTAESTPPPALKNWRMPRGQPVYLKSSSEGLTAAAEFRYKSTWSDTPVNPLAVEYDGWTLRDLLEVESALAQERPVNARLLHPLPIPFTALQRSAISAHWSAELRAKIAASKERERRTVTIEEDE